MKRRYTIRPKGWIPYVDYDREDVRDGADLTVYEGAPPIRDTGLIGPEGEKILATDESHHVGFLKDDLNERD